MQAHSPIEPLTLSEDEFHNIYDVLPNETDDGDDIYLFSTEEMEIVNKYHSQNRVWTCVECDEGLTLVNGIAFVNRLYYLVTKQAHDPNKHIEVLWHIFDEDD